MDQHGRQEHVGRGGVDQEHHSASGTAVEPYLTGPQDPVRMRLLDHEREWALNVKAALQRDPELDHLSDFMYAQIAIVEKGDIGKAIARAQRLQEYRQEYDIREDYKAGKRAIEAYPKKFPAHLLHFQYMEILGVFGIMLDFCNFDTDVFASVEGEKTFFAAIYYMNHGFNLDFQAVREGPFVICECGGFQMKAPRMIDLRAFRIMMEQSAYPTLYYKMRFCNGGVLMNVLLSMMRRCTPAEVYSRFQVSNDDETRLDQLCLTPNPQAASDRLFSRLCEALQRRYENERSFTLEAMGQD